MEIKIEGLVVKRDAENYSRNWYNFGDVSTSENKNYPECGPFLTDMLNVDFAGKRVRITIEVLED